jgi:hypothetical protein
MFAGKSTDKIEIKDTNPDEFGDFLKAISPKQEHPNRKFHMVEEICLILIIFSLKCARFAQIGQRL